MSLQNILDTQHINDYIKEYLLFNNFTNTHECFEAEIKTKQVSNKLLNKKTVESNFSKQMPHLYDAIINNPEKKSGDFDMHHKFEFLHRKYLQILEAGRQIFSISVNILEFLNKNYEVKN